MPGTIPKLMNAVWYEANGDAADVLVHGEMPVPQPAAGEVLVRLGASGVNPSDVKARAGSRPMGFDRVIPHSDGAGTVEMVGEGVDPDLQGPAGLSSQRAVAARQWNGGGIYRP